MRIRRREDPPFSFGMRSLLWLMMLSAIAMAWGAFFMLMMLAGIAIQYCLLAALASVAATWSAFPSRKPYRSWRPEFIHDDGGTLLLCTTVYLIFLHLLHVFMMLTWLPSAYPLVWHAPTLGGIPLADVEHLTLIGFSVLLITSFLTRIYGGNRFSRRSCMETATLLTLLHVSHYVIP